MNNQAPIVLGTTRGEMRLKYYKEFEESDKHYKGPYPLAGLDSFVLWYQKARDFVESNDAKEVESVVLTDGLRESHGWETSRS